MKEVQDGLELQTGDEVEFTVVLNQRTGKFSACNVRRIRYRLRQPVKNFRKRFASLSLRHMTETSHENNFFFFLLCSCHSEAPKPVVTPRPERLVKRLKSVTLDDANAPRLIVLRQPRGPDSTKVPLHYENRFGH